MAAQAINLIAQRLFGDFIVRRLPFRPAFPEIAAAPAGHHENSFAVGEIEKLLRLDFAFEADGVEAHVADVPEFVMESLRILAQHHVGGPTAAANENVFSVDVEGAAADGI